MLPDYKPSGPRCQYGSQCGRRSQRPL